MAKHRKSRKHTKRTHRRRSASSCAGTPIRCKVKQGNGEIVLDCGMHRPILLKAGRGGKLAPMLNPRTAARRAGERAARKQKKMIDTLMPFPS